MRDPFIEEALAAPAPAVACRAPVDPARLAEYLDGALEPLEAEGLEAHLADCAACRALASEAALAVEEAPPAFAREVTEREDGPRRSLQGPLPWALAALAFLALGAGLWLRSGGSAGREATLLAVGLDPGAVAELPRPERARLLAALRGELPAVEILPDGAGPGAGSVLRGASLAEAALPLSPRWSLLRSRRPDFRWIPSPLALEEAEEEPTATYRGEIFLVDGEERLVARLPFATPAGPSPRTLPLPAELLPLAPGGTYFWKVNEEYGAEILASEYVPFRILEEGAAAVGGEGYGAAAGFGAAAEAASAGLYEEALERLTALSVGSEGEEVRLRLARAVLRAKRLPPELAREELAWRSGLAAEVP